LSLKFYDAPPHASLQAAFVRPHLPIHLDIGCASGDYLLEMAQRHPDRNHVGLDVRVATVESASAKRKQLGLNNVVFYCNNLELSHQKWFQEFGSRLQYVTVLHPDPAFKNKHAKRRVLSPRLLGLLAWHLQQGAVLRIQTDVLALFQYMKDQIARNVCFDEHTEMPNTDVATPRERFVMAQGGSIYRTTFLRNARVDEPPYEYSAPQIESLRGTETNGLTDSQAVTN
jgi:tRNA (guanine-N7-)-methyltransferase